MRILIKGGRVIDPKSGLDSVMDIYIEDGIICDLEPGLDLEGLELEVIDAKGKIVAPGLIDMHCHLRDPGFEYKEDIETGTRSAAKGGFTTVACMPNTNPVIDNKAVAQYIFSKAKSSGVVNVFPIGAITKGLEGKELAEIGELKFAGCVGISDDGRPVMNPSLMRRAMQYADMFDITIISHCEDLSLADGGVMNEGFTSTHLGLRGSTRAAEEVMVARDVILAGTLGVPVHIAHVSTKGSVDIIRQAKMRGVRVTCETCPHYFTLTEEAVNGYDTNAKVNPPLRTAQDVEAVILGIEDGTIDAIATDHAPHHIDEKTVEFEYAPSGIVGFETALSLGLTYLVEKGHIDLKRLIELMTASPAAILGLNKGALITGKPADITIFDPDADYTVDVSAFDSKSKNSPFNGFKLKGRVLYTIVGGEIVVREGVLL